MNRQHVINSVVDYVKNKLSGECTGHDWFHTLRVWKTATKIAVIEKADLFIVELTALLHDIADWKFNDGDEKAGAIEAERLLRNLCVDEAVIGHVSYIISNISFKGAQVNEKLSTIEGMVVQDADRLDAIGAIGIARTFAYGGKKNREIYNPEIKPVLHDSFEAYKSGNSSTINHFYEKLLLLKERMNTQAGKEMAKSRHEFVEHYLNQFFKEWDGEI